MITKNTTCFASKTCGGVYGCIVDTVTNGKTDINGHTLEHVRREYPDAEETTVGAFCAWKGNMQRAPIDWLETTHEKYWEMLGVVPPAFMLPGGFLVGEPMDHEADTGRPRYSAFRQEAGKYWTASRAMTLPDFLAEMKKAI